MRFKISSFSLFVDLTDLGFKLSLIGAVTCLVGFWGCVGLVEGAVLLVTGFLGRFEADVGFNIDESFFSSEDFVRLG